MKTIYLCGFMGCGKSFLGKRLAKKLDVPFTDLDDYIVKKEGRSIPDIFASDGEPYFRKVEAECIRELAGGGVVATGGGALLNPETAAFANETGYTVYLDVSFPACYGRIKNDTNRPLVVNNTKEQLNDIYNKRKEIYRKHARYTVKAGGEAQPVIERILKTLNIDSEQK